ncbi:glutamine synthetase 1, mitochondrial-like [Drosophila takahashii]|uniref:glutamine synthetase 1, mitochondrial-like n=1 Tax=Drosophila takahashii TaxID=29030 RepID=UPI001CF8F6B8|nr:glutamine synthetase 1, mitochondrial-like [Drosophila takahashii]
MATFYAPRLFLTRQLVRFRSHFLANSPNASLDKSILQRYSNLETPTNRVQATYLWIDSSGERTRLKDRILDKVPSGVEDLPDWQYAMYNVLDGENTLKPRRIYRDPFKPGKKDMIVLCETYSADGKPSATNKRAAFQEAVDRIGDHEDPWFGIEQEYFLMDVRGRPFGWPANGFPAPQGPYYCGLGANRVFGRDLVEAHTLACLYAGIDFSGSNAEVMPSQWKYQVGPSGGLKASDDLWVSRYILQRIAEEYGLVVTFDPKNGAHTKFSTKAMREEGGIRTIQEAIEKLSRQHERHIKAYDPKEGEDNSIIDKFSWGVANRATSVRVPSNVATAGKGYLEDRRPRSNSDPYAVCGALVRTCLLNE